MIGQPPSIARAWSLFRDPVTAEKRWLLAERKIHGHVDALVPRDLLFCVEIALAEDPDTMLSGLEILRNRHRTHHDAGLISANGRARVAEQTTERDARFL